MPALAGLTLPATSGSDGIDQGSKAKASALCGGCPEANGVDTDIGSALLEAVGVTGGMQPSKEVGRNGAGCVGGKVDWTGTTPLPPFRLELLPPFTIPAAPPPGMPG